MHYTAFPTHSSIFQAGVSYTGIRLKTLTMSFYIVLSHFRLQHRVLNGLGIQWIPPWSVSDLYLSHFGSMMF